MLILRPETKVDRLHHVHLIPFLIDIRSVTTTTPTFRVSSLRWMTVSLRGTAWFGHVAAMLDHVGSAGGGGQGDPTIAALVSGHMNSRSVS